MSLKRYYISGLHPHIWEHPEGEMVYFEDYVTLQAENARLKAEVEAQAKRWAESEDLISHYKQQMDEVINDCQCSRLKAEVERLTKAHSDALADFWAIHKGYFDLKAEVERLRAASFVTAVPVEEYEKLNHQVADLKVEVQRLILQVNYWRIESDCNHGRWLRCLEELEKLRSIK